MVIARLPKAPEVEGPAPEIPDPHTLEISVHEFTIDDRKAEPTSQPQITDYENTCQPISTLYPESSSRTTDTGTSCPEPSSQVPEPVPVYAATEAVDASTQFQPARRDQFRRRQKPVPVSPATSFDDTSPRYQNLLREECQPTSNRPGPPRYGPQPRHAQQQQEPT